ncbi:5-formyltetrahydrofolate cyclo-ligase [Kiloniella sp.]|uniref:5-formyltetrahydrofolate cyclo-ligase n=1 Tax=Kiloniella sp. TaxID=1938587 RepID=UPI003A9515BC
MTNDWKTVQNWRKTKRLELRSLRKELSVSQRTNIRKIVSDHLRHNFPELQKPELLKKACICFCWPFEGEINFLDLVRDSLENGATAALPVVVEKNQPLEFWAWHPGMKMVRGIWDIPMPEERILVTPTIALVPLVGFDNEGYRLGYGGGYFDRTLASLSTRPLSIGVGYSSGHLETIYPQPHDIPMDAIVTEKGCSIFKKPNQRIPTDTANLDNYSSPPCFMHKVDPVYLGYKSQSELIALLNDFRENELEGLKIITYLSKQPDGQLSNHALTQISDAKNKISQMLSQHISRLGQDQNSDKPMTKAKVSPLPASPDQALVHLKSIHHQSVQIIQDTLPRVENNDVALDLQNMLDTYEEIIKQLTSS